MLRQEEPDMEFMEKLKLFLIVHWRGVVCVVVPLLAILILLPLPAQNHQWCAYCLAVMAIFWITECIPIAITSFIPVIIFPLTGIMSTTDTCKAYVNDTVLMFLGSLVLAYSVEQSGLHKRLAYLAIRTIGYSHYKVPFVQIQKLQRLAAVTKTQDNSNLSSHHSPSDLDQEEEFIIKLEEKLKEIRISGNRVVDFMLLLSICLVTCFVSLWITNTAATTMMVPINFAILRVFENHKMLKIYETGNDGEKIASDITTCYFCATTFSATIGGIGTLVGTATNLAFKGLFISAFPTAPEYLSFPKFSMCMMPLVVLMQICMYIYMVIHFFGLFRPNSEAAKSSKLTPVGIAAAKKAVDEDWAKLGKLSFWEFMVIILFGGAMTMFFCRSPQLFPGWGDAIADYYEKEHRFILDSALAFLVAYLMLLLPANFSFFKNFSAKFREDLTKQRVRSVLDWTNMMATMPYSFTFLIGGGFALSNAAKSTGLNDKIGEVLQQARSLPDILVVLIITIVVIFFTNFASNVAICNVFAPIAMQLAKETDRNPLLYGLTAGISASFCFMIPVGTPGNLIAQSAASIPTRKMMVAGFGPTIAVVVIIWLGIYFWAPVIWPDIHEKPDWATRRVLASANPLDEFN